MDFTFGDIDCFKSDQKQEIPQDYKYYSLTSCKIKNFSEKISFTKVQTKFIVELVYFDLAI